MNAKLPALVDSSGLEIIDPFTPLDTALAAFDAVTLDELVDNAGLLTRVDRKYVLPDRELAALLAGLGEGNRVLDIDGRRSFNYESVYFDTPELESYIRSARAKGGRFKVRTRTYLDSGLSFLEVKTRDPRNRTVKARIRYDADHRQTLTGEARTFLLGFRETAPFVDALRPTLTTEYQRATLLQSDASRATIDTMLRARDCDGAEVALTGHSIVETKSGGQATPVDRALRRLGHHPERISKYATDLAALRPELPANRWARTLRRHYAG